MESVIGVLLMLEFKACPNRLALSSYIHYRVYTVYFYRIYVSSFLCTHTVVSQCEELRIGSAGCRRAIPMVAAEAAEPEVATILTGKWIASRSCSRRRCYSITIRCTGTGPRRAVAIVASKVAQP